MNQKKFKKFKGRLRMSYSDYSQIRHERIPDIQIWRQNEEHKQKILQITKDFDPNNIRDLDLLIFKSYYKQVECVQKLKNELDQCLNEMFKLEIFIKELLERNQFDELFVNFNFLREINSKIDYIDSIYEQEIQFYYNKYKDTQIYKSYLDSITKQSEQFMDYLSDSVQQTEKIIIKLQEKRKIWVRQEPIPKERTSWQLYNPFSYILPKIEEFQIDVSENINIQSKAEKAIQLAKQGYQCYKDSKYDDAIQKLDASLICNPQLAYAYIGKAICLSQIQQNENKSVDQQKIIKAFDKAIELEPNNFLFQLNRCKNLFNFIQIQVIFYHNNRMTIKSFDIIFDMQDKFSEQQKQEYYQFKQLSDMIPFCPYRDDPKIQSTNGNGYSSDSDSDF